MDNRPIGLLDSGVGGLTVASQLFQQLPNESIVFIGDTARMPYGPRSEAEILQFTWDMVNFLLSKDVKMIVIACNTATAAALDVIKAQVNIPIIGVISPGVSAAVQKSSGKIGVIATEATVKSKAYQEGIEAKTSNLEVESLACPDFVPLVEFGDFENDEAQALISEKLQPLVGKVDSLVLGCTHFPLLAGQIQKAMGKDVELIDPAVETVKSIAVLLDYFDLNASVDAKLSNQFYTTGDIKHFQLVAEKWLNRPVDIKATKIETAPLLIATRNPGKVREFAAEFAKIGYPIESLLDHPELPDVEETGSSFEENARLKAETIAELTGRVVISDDSGLCVDVLGGLPGIWSHRFSGPDATDSENNFKLLHELASTETTPERRTAHFHATLVAAKKGKESLVVEADWPGRIALEPQGEDGFGYDPLFLIGDTDKSAADIPSEEKNQISHRGLALKKLMAAFPDWLSN